MCYVVSAISEQLSRISIPQVVLSVVAFGDIYSDLRPSPRREEGSKQAWQTRAVKAILTRRPCEQYGEEVDADSDGIEKWKSSEAIGDGVHLWKPASDTMFGSAGAATLHSESAIRNDPS